MACGCRAGSLHRLLELLALDGLIAIGGGSDLRREVSWPTGDFYCSTERTFRPKIGMDDPFADDVSETFGVTGGEESRMTPRQNAELTPAAVLAILRLLSARRAAQRSRLSSVTRLRGGAQ